MKVFLLAGTALIVLPSSAICANTVTAVDATSFHAAQTSDSQPVQQPAPQSAVSTPPTVLPAQAGQEIVVTAERRTERLKDVPVAVSVYDGKKRDTLGIYTVDDVAKFTPSTSFSDFPNRLFIRGVGRFTNQLGSDPGVATYNDGFYSSETTAVGGNPIQVDRIEVLRGPQGTLYGRNSIGGAVNVISRQPTADTEGEVRLFLGNYGQVAGAASISGPITSWLRYRVLGEDFYQARGFIKNVSGPDTYDRSAYQVGEAQLAADLSSQVTAWIKYVYYRSDGGAFLNNQIDPYSTAVYFGPTNLVANPTYGLTTPNPGANDLFKGSFDYPGYERTRNANQVIAHLNWDMGGAVLKYIGGYQSSDYSRGEDFDRSARASYDFFGKTVHSDIINTITDDKRYYSHELQLASNNHSPLRYIFGLYYYHENESQTYDLAIPDEPNLGYILLPPTYTSYDLNPSHDFLHLGARQKATSYAAYGQLDYSVTPTITLTGGLRYTKDKKNGYEERRYVLYAPYVFGGYPLDVTPAGSPRNISGEWSDVSGTARIKWEPDSNTNLYASYSRGYKAGGFNLFSFTDPVGKEQLNSFEVGLKKTFFENLQTDLAAYYYDYHNLQIPVTFIDVVPIVNFVNAPRARSLGFEAEATWSITNSLQLFATYSYLDAKLTKFCCFVDVANAAAGNQNLAGNPLPQSPKNKLTVSILNRFILGRNLTMTPVATLNYTGAQYFAPFRTPKYRENGFTRADFRLVFENNHGLELDAFVNNAFNNRSFNGFQLGPNFERQVTINLPRTFGATLIAKLRP